MLVDVSAALGQYLFLLKTLSLCLAGHLTILDILLTHSHFSPDVLSPSLSTSTLVEEPTLVWRTSVHRLPQEHTVLVTELSGGA